MRHAARRDATEAEIVAVLRGVGCSVYAVSAPDFPDLVIGMNGLTILAEVKLAPGTGVHIRQTRPRAGQTRFAQLWRGSPVVLLRTPEDALQLVASLRDVVPDGAVARYRQRRLDSHRMKDTAMRK